MPKQSLRLDRVFQALADPTRRDVLERLGRGPSTTSDLAQLYDMALPTFTQHLEVLEGCGLVRSRKQGRVRTYVLAPRPLKQVEHWLVKQRTLWELRLEQLDDYLQDLKERKA
ncbi:MAG: helix-turn-helix transcriptional regulator [Planctomycetes bacterium]|nr:helix-turn-helix transcriptional regulator [Planctomycetota bacterium]